MLFDNTEKLTIITSLRSFDMPQFGVIQRNALMSWKQLRPTPEIIVMGDDPGVREICKELVCRRLDVAYEDGAPLLDDMVKKADEHASSNYIALVSGDVLLFQNVISAFRAIVNHGFTSFCAVCRKLQQRTVAPLDFSTEDWQKVATDNVRLGHVTSGDLFIYSKGYWDKMPPFVMGRCHCDNYFYHSASKKGNMINLSEACYIIDYQHEYPHVNEDMRGSAGCQKNKDICPEERANLEHANWKVTPAGKVVRVKKGKISSMLPDGRVTLAGKVVRVKNGKILPSDD